MKIHKLLQQGLQAQAGQRTVWELKVPPEGEIKSIVLKQTGGTTAATFTLDLFDSKKVLEESASSGGADPDGRYTPDPDMLRVCDTLTGTAGLFRRFYDGDGVSYCNTDGGSTNRERRIYAEIEIPGGTDLTTWDIAIRVASDIG